MDLELPIEIKRVDAEMIRPLRHAELRKGQDFSTTSYLKDNEESTFHMASILDGKIVTCATFYPQKSGKLNALNSYLSQKHRVSTKKEHQVWGIILYYDAI